MKGRLLLLGLLGGFGTTLYGAEEDAGRQLVDEFISGVTTLQGDFEQALIDAEGQLLEKSSGTLEIQRPGRFRWAYVEPYEQWLVADGLNIWSYDLDLEQVTVKPQAEALANTPALLLGGSGDALEQFEIGADYVEADTHWVTLHPVDTEGGFQRIKLGFMNERLHRMVFFDNLEQKTLVSLYDVKVNEPLDAERFDFVVPDDVDLVGTPAVADNVEP